MMTADERERAREAIRDGAALSPAYMAMNMLAAVIATYGLFENSAAVVIGAMIVAMLLGPITGVGLSLVDADMRLLAKTLPTLLAGAGGVVAVAAVLGLVHRHAPITDEILARTAPNLMDLMIALAGGAAGAIATVSPRLTVAFVGVAIATALVPPLTAGTLLFVRGEYHLAGGAYLLTLTNIIGIQFANSLVLWLAGFRRATAPSGMALGVFVRSNLVTLGILVGLGVLLTFDLRNTIAEEEFKSSVRSALSRWLEGAPGTYLAGVRLEHHAGRVIVSAVVRGPSAPDAKQVAAMEDNLPRPPAGSIELQIRFVEAQTIDRNGSVWADAEFAPQP